MWRELPASPARDRLKGLIQIAGALELRRKGRENAAARLALRALEHLAGEEGVELPTVGRLSVAGARALLEVLAREEAGGEVRALFCALT